MTEQPKPRRATFGITLLSILRWLGGGLTFVAFVSLIAPLTFVVDHRRLEFLIRPMTHLVVWFTGARVRVHGLERLDPNTPYVFLWNHINMFDHFILYSRLGRPLRGVEKELHFGWPVYGLLIRRLGLVPIPPRGDTERAIRSLDELRKLFETGMNVAIAPEGTRSVDGRLQRFKKGAFHLAMETGAPIVPVVLTGMYELNRKGDWRIYPANVDVYVEEPIETAGLTKADVNGLMTRARDTYERRLASVGLTP